MTVKEFLEKTTGVTYYEFEGKDFYYYCYKYAKDEAIKRIGDRKIISIEFTIDSDDNREVIIEIE